MRWCSLSIFLFAFAGILTASPAPAHAGESPAYLDDLVERADSDGLAEHPQWHALLHYRPGLFGGVRSDIDSPEFFLHDDGKSDPAAELRATLAAFVAPASAASAQRVSSQDHPRCRFPARYAWLHDRLDVSTDRLPDIDCDAFDAWRDDIDADSATLIFAAQHLTVPASMFGHTLMRLDRPDDGYGAELDDYVVNVTADPWTHNPVLYIAMGLTGGFDGVFETLPFETKIHKYTDREHREMWEYELQFDDRQLDRLVAHLWELHPHNADYRYFDENCSYFLMSILEAADPSLSLVDQFGVHVLPGEMVRAVLNADGMDVRRSFRPSARQAMLETRARLDAGETHLAHRLGADEDETALAELDRLDQTRRAHVLEAAHALWRYRNPPDEGAEQVESDWARQLRRRRDELDATTPPVIAPAHTAPEGAHGPTRVSVAGGYAPTQQGIFELGFRPALHDLNASDVGYAPLSQIEFLNTRIRASGLDGESEWPAIHLRKLDVLDVTSLSPIDRWSRRWSWSLKTGLDRTFAGECPEMGCLYYDAAFGFGATAEFGPLAAYGLFDTQLATGPAFDHYFRAAAGPRIGTLVRIGRLARIHLQGRYRYPVWGEGFPGFQPAFDRSGPPWAAEATVSLSPTTNLEFRAGAHADRGHTEATLELHFYF